MVDFGQQYNEVSGGRGRGGAPEHKMAFVLAASPSLRSTGGFVAGSRLPGDILRYKISKPSLCCPSSPASFARKCCLSASMLVPFRRDDAREPPPPDLASSLYKNRIVYLGMPLVPSVTELILAEFLYLQYEDAVHPINLYINSAGAAKVGEKLPSVTEAFAIYDVMRFVKPPIFTLCVGNAWGEAALLLAAGTKGHRAALPSSRIMIRRHAAQCQEEDTDSVRKIVRDTNFELICLYSFHTGEPPWKISEDIRRPKYLTPHEAVEYGIIDKVLFNEREPKER
ncbi:unnamed protein product [Musa hybrid cultivar]